METDTEIIPAAKGENLPLPPQLAEPAELAEELRQVWRHIAGEVWEARQAELAAMSEAERKKAVAKEERRRVKGLSPAVRARAIEFLCRYAKGEKPSKALESMQMEWGEFVIAKTCEPVLGRIYNYCCRKRAEIISAKAEERLEEMVEGSVSEKGGNIHAITFALERLKRGQYARDYHSGAEAIHARDEADTASGKRGQVIYNINIQSAVLQPKKGKIGATIMQPSEVVDVESH